MPRTIRRDRTIAHSRFLTAILLIFPAVWALPVICAAKPANSPVVKSKTVSLTVDYGDGSQRRFTAIPWKAEMTVWDAMQVVEGHKRGVKFKVHGKGEIALLTRIDDLQNQGGGKLNWIFRVNSKLGETSFGVAKLKQGDAVLWKFDEYR